MQLNFVTVDVFTDARFAGNPLAVVLNANGLSTHEMQAIASEFNLSETTFVLPPAEPAHTAAVRIFTPRQEMPFAGHPNIGTAFALASAGACYGRPIDGPLVVFEEKAGLVPITLIKDGGSVRGARLAAPQSLAIGPNISAELISAACALTPDDIVCTNHSPCIASCGAAFILAEVNDRAALARANPQIDVIRRSIAPLPASSILLYASTDDNESDIRARMFAPLHNILEDPATGSANVALIGLLAALNPACDLTLSKRILQGVEMGRPSVLLAQADKRNGVVTATHIGGSCIPVMTGTIAWN